MRAHPIWRVYVLKPLGARERKQTLSIYRVGAETAEVAIERVRDEIVNDRERGRNLRIVRVIRFGQSDSVVYDGMVTRTPAEATAMPTL